MILAAAAVGGLLAASSTSKAHALGYTFADLNNAGLPTRKHRTTFDEVPPSTTWCRSPGAISSSSGNLDGSLYAGGKYVTADAPDAIDTSIYGINDPGQAVGTASDSNGSLLHDLIAPTIRDPAVAYYLRPVQASPDGTLGSSEDM